MRDQRLYLLTAGIAVVGSNSLSLSPISAEVAADLGDANAADVMIASAAYGVGVALSALFLAPFIDRIGADRALRTALAILFAALLASAAAGGITGLAAAQAVAGVAAGGALPAIYALSAQIAPKGRESEALGLVLAGWTISMVAGVGLAGLTAEVAHWRALFGGLAAFAVLLWLLMARTGEWGSVTSRRPAESPVAALKTPGIGPALLSTAAYMIAFYGSYAFLGAHTADALGRGATDASLVALAYGVGFGAAAPLGKVIDRLGQVRVAPLAFGLLAAVYFALAALASVYWAVVVLAAVWGVANHLGLNLIVGGLAALDPRRRGAIMGLYSAVVYFCVSIGATAFRPIYEEAGWAVVLTLGGIAILSLLVSALSRARAACRGGSFS